MTVPFEISKPSPIGVVRGFLARGQEAVVANRMTDKQDHAYIESELDDRLSALLSSQEAPDLLVISGSAGFGKSALIASAESRHPGLLENIVRDATHSDSPSESQADALGRFFEPFADGQPPPTGGTRVIAANTGMLIQFFHQLDKRGITRFASLEAVIKFRLGLRASDEGIPAIPWKVVVLNLDLRPTAGPGGLVAGIIKRLDFSNPVGVLGEDPRCATCQVRDYCPVRTNSLLAASGAEAIDILIEQSAVERGRQVGPRQIYDLAARLLTGDDAFDGYEDPCFAVAAAAERDDRAWVWEHLLPRVLFSVEGELGERISALDPSLRPSSQAHDLLSTAGLNPGRDSERISELDPGGAEAIESVARYVRGGLATTTERGLLGRALVAASFLQRPREWEIRNQVAQEFAVILDTYNRWSQDPAGVDDVGELQRLMHRAEQALARTFGVVDGGQPYLPVHSYDPRDQSRIFVAGNLTFDEHSFHLVLDPQRARDPQGAELAGHVPLSLTVQLGGVELALSLPVYQLIAGAAERTLASTSDLERSYALRHAVEALARRASEAATRLMIEQPLTDRHYLVTKVPGLLRGQEMFSVQEVAR